MVEHWERWQDNPTAPIIRAADLSDEEQKEFIIKDNVGYGEWDYDMLANVGRQKTSKIGAGRRQSDNNDGGDSAGEAANQPTALWPTASLSLRSQFSTPAKAIGKPEKRFGGNLSGTWAKAATTR